MEVYDVATVLAFNLVVAVGLMTLIWMASLALRDASIVDRFWGLGFVLLAWSSWLLAPDPGARGLFLSVLVTGWGLRLSAHITWRNWGEGEDKRYRAMRERAGARFGARSFFTIFLLQAVLLWIIALPVQVGMASAGAAPFPTALDFIGAAVALAGILTEIVADLQLARFRGHPENANRVMDHGLWRYSRHPNYFGEATAWWGLYLLSCSTLLGAWTILSPLLITWLLLRVSGVPLLEQDLRQRRPDYADYIRRTPAFVPWFPKAKP